MSIFHLKIVLLYQRYSIHTLAKMSFKILFDLKSEIMDYLAQNYLKVILKLMILLIYRFSSIDLVIFVLEINKNFFSQKIQISNPIFSSFIKVL